MNWFWLSLTAVFFWSASDVTSKIGSKPEEKTSHWRMVIAVGLVMGLHAIFMIATGTEFHARDIITYLPASFCYILSMILGYVGLRYIELSLSTPICNCSGAVAAVLCFIFLRQTMASLQLVAVVMIVGAIFAFGVIEKNEDPALREASGIFRNIKYQKSALALILPLLYCILDGLGTFVDALLLDTVIAEEQANIAYELTFLAMAVFAYIYVVFVKKEKFPRAYEGPKFIAAITETAGQFAYIYALGANAIVAAPMISSYCLFSVIWSRIFLHEKLEMKHYVTIAVAVVGIIILGMEGE